MALRRWLRKVERAARGDLYSIRQKDGTVYYFGQEDLKEAFLRNCTFLRARANGEEPPEPHPLQIALVNAAHQEIWHGTYVDLMDDSGPVEDLSEP